jgi:hypothetical protein
MSHYRTTRITVLCVAVVLSFALQLRAADSPSKAEFEALQARVEKLEATLAYLQLGIEAEASDDLKPESKTSLLDNVITVIHKREDNINYPWMDSQLWANLKPGLSTDAVISILGRPTLNEPSLHKRIDTVFTYKGKQVSTGDKITGVVRFYRDKITDIEPPKI